MTAPTEDGGALDPTIARVLLDYRESVAQATERAILDLVHLGVDRADAMEIAEMGWHRLRRLQRTVT